MEIRKLWRWRKRGRKVYDEYFLIEGKNQFRFLTRFLNTFKRFRDASNYIKCTIDNFID